VKGADMVYTAVLALGFWSPLETTSLEVRHEQCRAAPSSQ
jgi:hypothetical protein